MKGKLLCPILKIKKNVKNGVFHTSASHFSYFKFSRRTETGKRVVAAMSYSVSISPGLLTVFEYQKAQH